MKTTASLISASLLLFVLIFALGLVQSTLAAPLTVDNPKIIPCTNDCNFYHLLELIKNVVKYLIFYLAVPLASVAILVAGITYVTAGTNSGKCDKAKGIIWAAIWGLVLALAAQLIIQTILDFLLTKNPYTS